MPEKRSGPGPGQYWNLNSSVLSTSPRQDDSASFSAQAESLPSITYQLVCFGSASQQRPGHEASCFGTDLFFCVIKKGWKANMTLRFKVQVFFVEGPVGKQLVLELFQLFSDVIDIWSCILIISLVCDSVKAMHLISAYFSDHCFI